MRPLKARPCLQCIGYSATSPPNGLTRSESLHWRGRPTSDCCKGAFPGFCMEFPLASRTSLTPKGYPPEWDSPIFENNLPSSSAAVVEWLGIGGWVCDGKNRHVQARVLFPGEDAQPVEPCTHSGWVVERFCGGHCRWVCAAAVGTRTNGSVIRPAAIC